MAAPIAMMELHPQNLGFAWRDHEGPFRIVTPQQARDYDELGYFCLRGAFDAETVARVAAEIDPLEERTTEFLRGQPEQSLFIATADQITFTVHIVLHSEWVKSFCAGPVFSDLCHDLIGPDARLYWDQAVYKKPEPEREFPWHQDNGYTYIEPQAYLTCWVALTDADEENGCPWVVPGLHREGTLRHELTPLGWRCLDRAPQAVPLPVRAGDIAVFSSLTPHRTGPNRTGATRKSYIVQFAPDGAVRLDSGADGARVEHPQDDPSRQFPVLIGGNRPAAE